MKLSEQIEQTCCGVLADKQEMIDKAQCIENAIEVYERRILKLQARLMEIDNVE